MATETFQKELDNIKADFGSLRKDVNKLFETALGKGKAAAGSTFDSVKGSGVKAVESCKNGIEKHPIASIFIALGTGFVVGKIMNSVNGRNGGK